MSVANRNVVVIVVVVVDLIVVVIDAVENITRSFFKLSTLARRACTRLGAALSFIQPADP